MSIHERVYTSSWWWFHRFRCSTKDFHCDCENAGATARTCSSNAMTECWHCLFKEFQSNKTEVKLPESLWKNGSLVLQNNKSNSFHFVCCTIEGKKWGAELSNKPMTGSLQNFPLLPKLHFAILHQTNRKWLELLIACHQKWGEKMIPSASNTASQTLLSAALTQWVCHQGRPLALVGNRAPVTWQTCPLLSLLERDVFSGQAVPQMALQFMRQAQVMQTRPSLSTGNLMEFAPLFSSDCSSFAPRHGEICCRGISNYDYGSLRQCIRLSDDGISSFLFLFCFFVVQSDVATRELREIGEWQTCACNTRRVEPLFGDRGDGSLLWWVTQASLIKFLQKLKGSLSGDQCLAYCRNN